MAHLARNRAPKNWPIKRKKTKWITRPSSGAHALDSSISANLLLKETINHVNTTREVKYIINNKSLIVDKKPVKDQKFAIGFLDIVEFADTKESYRVVLNEKGEFELIPLKKELDNLKLSSIIGKTVLRKGKVQLNFIDGRNLIVDKDTYKVGDSAVIDLSKKTIVNHLKLDKGSEVFLMGGKHKGTVGKVEKIIVEKNTNPDRIIVKANKGEFETLKKYAFVIDKKFLEK